MEREEQPSFSYFDIDGYLVDATPGVAKHFLDRFEPDDLNLARRAFARALSGEPVGVLDAYLIGIPDESGTIRRVLQVFETRDPVAFSIRAERERFRSFFIHNVDSIAFLGIDGSVIRTNLMFEEMFAMSPGEEIGDSWFDFLEPNMRTEARDAFSQALVGEAQEFDSVLRASEELPPIPIRVRFTPLFMEVELIGISAVVKNIAAERVARQHMHNLAFYDPLTKLPNRSLFEDRLTQTIAAAKRYNRPFGLLFLDLDGFKSINDLHGHAAGDAVLRAFGERTGAILRESDTFARLGGDEFAVLQELLRIPEDAEALSGKLIEALEKPFPIDGEALHVGLSIGIAVYPWHGITEASLLDAADKALYEAKSAGKNTFRFAGPF
ncbi:MAG: sensor domain-containing diguanylate cyclase [Candidatus Eremiobacteraeota bacterium]|nr:sensor domain-containing diguanylate cyclase [Candidatus Eremiobacteraeota bacterium]NNM91707.1 sensor domain-containing diguanylate cyclase [Candidatus Eremiobacteraeota bacterium]